eukprot:m.227208 g.227208  ORF g.227208 m.227208 type:complete len:114 (+) comp15660_c0_seq15:2308-2649(+)
MACGTSITPTVIPATASPTSFFLLYCGNHWTIGTSRCTSERPVTSLYVFTEWVTRAQNVFLSEDMSGSGILETLKWDPEQTPCRFHTASTGERERSGRGSSCLSDTFLTSIQP